MPGMPAPRHRYELLAIGTALYVAFGLISSAIAVLVGEVRLELGLSFAAMGVILGAWQFMYIFTALPLGHWVDRLGLRRALLLGGALMTASAATRAFASDFWTLLAAVALFGIGGPIVSIGLPKLVANHFPARERALATGIYATGASLGSAVALALTRPLLLPAFTTWRATYLFLAALGLAATLWWWWRGGGGDPRAAAAPEGFRVALGRVARSRAVWLVTAIGLTGFLLGHGVNSWLPQMLEAKGFDPLRAGVLSVSTRLGGVAGGLLAARLAFALGGARAATAVALTLSALALAAFQLGSSEGPLLIAMLAIGLSGAAIMPLATTLLMDVPDVGPARVGVAMGFFFALGEIGGFGGPALLGFVRDTWGGFGAGIWLLAAASAATLMPVGALGRSQTRS
jgi:cyanate permease